MSFYIGIIAISIFMELFNSMALSHPLDTPQTLANKICRTTSRKVETTVQKLHGNIQKELCSNIQTNSLQHS
jgi:hypothetical protein